MERSSIRDTIKHPVLAEKAVNASVRASERSQGEAAKQVAIAAEIDLLKAHMKDHREGSEHWNRAKKTIQALKQQGRRFGLDPNWMRQCLLRNQERELQKREAALY